MYSPSSSSGASDLPEGWTRHELAGKWFYFHQATNNIQPEHPALPQSRAVEMTSPTASAPPPPPPAAPAATQAVQAAFVYLDQHVPPVRQQPFMHTLPSTQKVPLMQSQTLQEAPQLPPLLFSNPRDRLEEVVNRVELRAQISSQPHAQASPLGGAGLVSVQPPVVQPQPQEQRTLNVLVPEPGLQPGQPLEFTTPAGPGVPSQRLSVTVQHAVAPGSIVTVQYPAAPQFQQAAPTIPLPHIDATFVEDHNAMVCSWWLYGCGLCMGCFCPPLCAIPWGIVLMWYYCKPAGMRAARMQQRRPARATLWTSLCGMFLAIVVAMVGSCIHHKHMRGAYKTGGDVAPPPKADEDELSVKPWPKKHEYWTFRSPFSQDLHDLDDHQTQPDHDARYQHGAGPRNKTAQNDKTGGDVAPPAKADKDELSVKPWPKKHEYWTFRSPSSHDHHDHHNHQTQQDHDARYQHHDPQTQQDHDARYQHHDHQTQEDHDARYQHGVGPQNKKAQNDKTGGDVAPPPKADKGELSVMPWRKKHDSWTDSSPSSHDHHDHDDHQTQQDHDARYQHHDHQTQQDHDARYQHHDHQTQPDHDARYQHGIGHQKNTAQNDKTGGDVAPPPKAAKDEWSVKTWGKKLDSLADRRLSSHDLHDHDDHQTQQDHDGRYQHGVGPQKKTAQNDKTGGNVPPPLEADKDELSVKTWRKNHDSWADRSPSSHDHHDHHDHQTQLDHDARYQHHDHQTQQDHDARYQRHDHQTQQDHDASYQHHDHQTQEDHDARYQHHDHQTQEDHDARYQHGSGPKKKTAQNGQRAISDTTSREVVVV